MAVGRRCSIGCATWPDQPLYEKCPICHDEAPRVSNVTPLGDDEALSIKAHAEFELYYERRCARMGVSVSGPLPDVLPHIADNTSDRGRAFRARQAGGPSS